MNASKKNKVTVPNTLPPVGGANPLPASGAPMPPVGWVPVKPAGARAFAPPLKSQVEQASAVAQELRATNAYAQFLGAKVPAAGAVADALDFAARWSVEVEAAEKWLEYVKNQAQLAWSFTRGLLEPLKAPLALETARDPAFDKELPLLKALVTARNTVAKRGAANRAARKRSAKKAASEPAKPTAHAPDASPGAPSA